MAAARSRAASAPAGAAAPAPRAWAWLIPAALVAFRFPFLRGPVDDPHSWRQCDTAYYSLHMVRHGIDLLRPQVCWLGAHGVLALEFPLVEAVSALLQRAFGTSVLWDRLVSLMFFVAAAAYFHALARRLLAPRAAFLALLAYLAMPLGVFFSRAAIVDFAAVACAHGMLFHGLAALRSPRPRHLALAGLFAALGALVKAPAVLPLAIALAWAAARSGRTSALRLALPLLAAAGVFALWRAHVEALNASAPSWDFIPGYHKITARWSWYFGDLSQRMDLEAWRRLLGRIAYEVTTWPGLALVAAGLIGWRRAAASGAAPRGLAGAWAAGAALYLLAFWPLNLLHDYYQIPLLAPAALAIGAGGAWLFGPERRRSWRNVAAPLLFGAFLAWCVAASLAIGYFTVDWRLVAAGDATRARVPADDLVIAAFEGSRYADPRLLVRADRRGWSLGVTELTPEVVRGLKGAGARWAAVLTTTGRSAPPAFLDSLRVAHLSTGRGDRGTASAGAGVLDIYDLGRWR